jgi:single-stranded DNA-binding protein
MNGRQLHRNLLSLVATVGTEIEFRGEPDGSATCSFSGVTEIEGEKVWHRIRAWGHRAKICQRLRMGDLVELVGPRVDTKSGRGTKSEMRALVIKVLK